MTETTARIISSGLNALNIIKIKINPPSIAKKRPSSIKNHFLFINFKRLFRLTAFNNPPDRSFGIIIFLRQPSNIFSVIFLCNRIIHKLFGKHSTRKRNLSSAKHIVNSHGVFKSDFFCDALVYIV